MYIKVDRKTIHGFRNILNTGSLNISALASNGFYFLVSVKKGLLILSFEMPYLDKETAFFTFYNANLYFSLTNDRIFYCSSTSSIMARY
jgi:hypothetical protein